jgi:hypothetical protein
MARIKATHELVRLYRDYPGDVTQSLQAMLDKALEGYDVTPKATPARPQVGDEVRVKGDGWKRAGRVTGIDEQVEVIDVTRDGSMYPFVADTSRQYAPGLRSTTLTVELTDEP